MSERTFYEQPIEKNGYKFIRLKGGRLFTFLDAVHAAQKARTDLTRAVSRAIKLVSDDYDFEGIEWLIEDLESYTAAVRKHLAEIRGNQTKRERIALLRNVSGRTPEEAELFRRKADELEARDA